MTRARRKSSWLLPVLLAAGAMLLHGKPAVAANADAPGPLQRQAEEFERLGQWDRAGEIYLKMLAADRQQPLIRQRLLLCLRHAQLLSRHRDRVYLERVQALSISQALGAYLDALGKLHANYVDRDKVALLDLFRYGLQEFDLALGDTVFAHEHLAGISQVVVREFRAKVQAEWADKTLRNPAEIRRAVRDIALAGQQALGLQPSLTVMEFVCGACNALDERTAYLAPAEETAALAGQLTALGVRLGSNPDGRLFVERLVPNSWAAGNLKVGDRITRWGRGDGEREDAAQLIEIDVVGRGDMTPHTLRLPTLLNSVVDVEMVPGGVGYLRIAGFQKSTPHEVDEALLNLKMRGLKALVVDLRGNPGGLFQVAVQVTEQFLPDGIIVTTHGQAAPFNRTYTSRSGMAALDVPLVLIVDGETASAAEVMAGALKENKRAVLVGQPTFGKGTIQQVMQLSAAGGVRLTLARFYTPCGEPYNGIGVTPHIPETSEPVKAAIDQARQLAQMRP